MKSLLSNMVSAPEMTGELAPAVSPEAAAEVLQVTIGAITLVEASDVQQAA